MAGGGETALCSNVSEIRRGQKKKRGSDSEKTSDLSSETTTTCLLSLNTYMCTLTRNRFTYSCVKISF